MLRQLSPLEQYITVARVIEGLTSQEIAELTGKTSGAIRMAIIGQNSDLPTSLVLCEDGVWNAIRDQWSEAIEMPF